MTTPHPKLILSKPKLTIVHYIALLMVGVLILYLTLGIGFGTWQMPHTMTDIDWQIRYPRVLTALIVGYCLSVGGSALQALFQNPLADPSLIGTSSGAALGVVGILSLSTLPMDLTQMGLGWLDLAGLSVALAAFLGALAVCVLILLCYRLFGGNTLSLLILGFVISAFCGAWVSLILFVSDDMVLRSATVWLSGSMAQAGFVPFGYVLMPIILGSAILFRLGKKLDILMLGDNTAISMGVNVFKTRAWAVVGASLLVGSAVALAGIIGFIGMMIPNILANAMGGLRTPLMVASGIMGAFVLLIIDSTARLVAYPVDLPVGIVLALIGAPFFMWLFIKAVRHG